MSISTEIGHTILFKSVILFTFVMEIHVSFAGDNEALLTLMLITRLIWKSEILLSQVRDKFPSVELANKGELVKGHTAEQFASRCRLSYHLYLLQVSISSRIVRYTSRRRLFGRTNSPTLRRLSCDNSRSAYIAVRRTR